ncbi:MAG: acyl-CoA dehydrogenase family protein [Gemmatimonadetes bacterium]|nr:acyl-CoA dehydrogenase family protein [Gemmatimonadota bacterium]
MADRSYLDWPFFEARHREIAGGIRAWTRGALRSAADLDKHDLPAACTSLARRMGAAGWLRHVVPAEDGRLDVRALCLIREALAYRHGVLDFVFALQGLGSGPISLFGTERQKQAYLPGVASGDRIAAFAITEAGVNAGSDIAAMKTVARRAGDGWSITGSKTWISNAGIADHYVTFCRLPDEGDRRFGAFIVDAGANGLEATPDIEIIAPHVLGTLELRDCRVPAEAMIGGPADGLRIALATLDVFRPTVGAAALGLARRALDEAVRSIDGRIAFGRALRDHQMTQSRIADMAVDIDAAALLVYRAAWARDRGADRTTREASIAKLHATEAAQRVVDAAVQLCGGRGVQRGHPVERLYREVRALRIYEGTSEIQKIIIAEQVLRDGEESEEAEPG